MVWNSKKFQSTLKNTHVIFFQIIHGKVKTKKIINTGFVHLNAFYFQNLKAKKSCKSCNKVRHGNRVLTKRWKFVLSQLSVKKTELYEANTHHITQYLKNIIL